MVSPGAGSPKPGAPGCRRRSFPRGSCGVRARRILDFSFHTPFSLAAFLIAAPVDRCRTGRGCDGATISSCQWHSNRTRSFFFVGDRESCPRSGSYADDTEHKNLAQRCSTRRIDTESHANISGAVEVRSIKSYAVAFGRAVPKHRNCANLLRFVQNSLSKSIAVPPCVQFRGVENGHDAPGTS